MYVPVIHMTFTLDVSILLSSLKFCKIYAPLSSHQTMDSIICVD